MAKFLGGELKDHHNSGGTVLLLRPAFSSLHLEGSCVLSKLRTALLYSDDPEYTGSRLVP